MAGNVPAVFASAYITPLCMRPTSIMFAEKAQLKKPLHPTARTTHPRVSQVDVEYPTKISKNAAGISAIR